MMPPPRKTNKPARVYFGTKIAETPKDTAPTISQEEFQRKFMGSTAKPEAKTYTGGNILGIATMHKSNLVPVFSSEAAVDLAKMRR